MALPPWAALAVVGITLFLAATIVAIQATATAAQSNPIQTENARAGTSSWQLQRPATDLNKEIKGYANLTSVNVGQTIDFHVSVNTPQTFTIDVYRMGYYGGNRGRLMTSIGPLNGTPQPYPAYDTTTGFHEFDWSVAHRLTIPGDWVSGMYLAKLTNANGFDNYVGFVVRNDQQQADFLFQRPILTDHAYNNFPNVDPSTPGFNPSNPAHVGKSLYDHNSGGGNTSIGTKRAYRISLLRPMSGNGVGLYFTWEADLIAWMEQSGYDISYSTNVDTERDPSRLLDFKAFVSPAHDEYWTGRMFSAAETARDSGVNLAFMGANSIYYQVKLQPDTDGNPLRSMLTYKADYLDPEPVEANKTGRFRDIGRPEQTLIGIQYIDYGTSQRAPLIVTNTDHWAFEGTGLTNGASIPGIVGSEIDIYDPAYPGPTNLSQTLLAASPYQGTLRGNHIQNTSIYQAPSGAWVFASGTLSWGWGLGRPGVANPAVQRLTANVFDRFVAGSGTGGGGGGTGDDVEVSARVRGITGEEVVVLRNEDGTEFLRQQVSTEWQTLTATVSAGSQDLYVAFVNDARVASGGTRDLLVDYVQWKATGDIVQAESVESMGVWNGVDCGIGYRNSQYLACNGWFRFPVPGGGGGGGTTTSTTTPTVSTTPTTSPSTSTTTGGGGGGSHSVAFVARGTTGSETVALQADGQIVGQWTLSTRNQTYEATVQGGVDVILVEFTNDGRTSTGADRNVIVESFQFDGQTFDPADVRSQGVWNGVDCGIGFRNSRFLACNGWFEFPVDGDDDGGGGGGTTSPFSVRLRGTTGTELATIEVDGVAGAPFSVPLDWVTREVPVADDATTIRVNFINDAFVNGADRNLIVDWVSFDGVQTSASQLRAKGVWDGSSCAVEAVHGTGYLACNGWIELQP